MPGASCSAPTIVVMPTTVAAIPRLTDELRRLTADNPNQQRRFALLVPRTRAVLKTSLQRRFQRAIERNEASFTVIVP